jgi:EAL domain-containing protein (putative c-di-GMP-specific phosphodiesterase class I)
MMMRLSQGFGQQTVAEGAEDDRTIELLRELGVDYAQGYGIAARRRSPMCSRAKSPKRRMVRRTHASHPEVGGAPTPQQVAASGPVIAGAWVGARAVHAPSRRSSALDGTRRDWSSRH